MGSLSDHRSTMSDDSGSSPAWEGSKRRLRGWLLAALILSLIIHGILFQVLQTSKLERFTVSDQTERLVPRPFAMKQAKIDPKAFDEPEKETPPEKLVASSRKLPELAPEKPTTKLPDKVKLTPIAPELAKPILNEKPGTVQSSASSLPGPRSSVEVEKSLDQARSALEKETAPTVTSAPIKLPTSENANEQSGQGGMGHGDSPTFSDLDDLLSKAGPLSGSVAPVNMPGGALFAYDSAELQPEAVTALQKLGELIKRNPRSTFSIEGHTDSTGDPTYNQRLSEIRAEAVKEWLVKEMAVDPSRIATRGFGSTRLLAPATGTKEQQTKNRRVEIVIKTPRR